MKNELELVLDARAYLGEGPCWDERENLLYWIDGLGKSVHVYDPVSGMDKVNELDQFVGCIVLRERGGCVLSLQNGLYFFDAKTGSVDLILNPEADIAGNRFNDGKCDGAGRLWCGSMSLKENEGSGNSPPAGSLYCLDVDLKVRKIFGGVGISNGLGWSPDGRTMYYIDSPTKNVDAFEFDPTTGSIGKRRTVVTIPKTGGIPDGMCVDAEGMLWVAQFGGGQISRWDPHTGTIVDRVPVPVPNVTCCAFGGEDLENLYITTSRIGVDEHNEAEFPHAGALFKVKSDVGGLRVNRFKA
ncbi:MAG: SMP-30/gluconolactonase/LRE family protein [Rectinemataceae bacterium]|jgi:sugar lactone lactonase YvrE